MTINKIQAVCFDMWGTLCEGGGGKGWFLLQRILGANSIDKETFHNLGLESLLLHPWSLRDGIKNLAKKLKLKVNKELIEKAYKAWWHLVERSKPYPEVCEVLDKLEQYKLRMLIISNTDSESFYYEIKKFNLKKYFEKFFISSEIGTLKQESKMFELAQDFLSIPKDQVLLVDDSLYHGVIPARSFGWQALWIARGKQEGDKYMIEDLRGIFDFL